MGNRRDVHSVGSGRRLAGGAEETTARSVRPFVEAGVLSGGGALRGAATVLPPSRRSQLGGAVLRLFPEPESVERRIRMVKLLKVTVIANQIEGDDVVARWRLLRAEVRRLPVRQGTPSIPRLQWRSGGGAGFFDADVFEVLQDWNVFFFFLWAVL